MRLGSRSAVTLALAVALSFVGCGGAAASGPVPAPPPAPDAAPAPSAAASTDATSDVVGFGSVGSLGRVGGGRRGPAIRKAQLAVAGEVRDRAVRLGSAFLLTPSVEGPVELHAFEGDVGRASVCPAGLAGMAPAVDLRVMLPDTRSAEDATLVTLLDGGQQVPARRVNVRVTGSAAPGGIAMASIDVEGDEGTRLRGAMPVYICPDDRSAEE